MIDLPVLLQLARVPSLPFGFPRRQGRWALSGDEPGLLPLGFLRLPPLSPVPSSEATSGRHGLSLSGSLHPEARKSRLGVVAVLWRASPSGCNFCLQSSSCSSGSDPYECQPVSLVRANRASWQPRAEPSRLQQRFPGVSVFR